jgi:lipopolysaccharide biosynthesis regulator YciM
MSHSEAYSGRRDPIYCQSVEVLADLVQRRLRLKPDQCARCGHQRSEHYNGRGYCCQGCSHFKRR